MKKTLNKPLKITLITLGVIVGLVLVLLIGVKIGEKLVFKSFYDNAEKEFKMPGTSDNLVQQGATYIAEKDLFLVCGYMSDDTASMVYVLDKDGNVTNKVRLKNADGSDYLGHTGGIEYNAGYVYITDGTKDVNYDGGLDVFPLEQILNETEAKTIGRVRTFNNPAFCHTYKGYMLVGEFYRETDYETLASHRFTTPAGDENTALIMVFRLDNTNTENLGLSEKPVAAISTTDAIQGLETIGDDKIVLSSSWGLSKSKLRFYDMDKINTQNIEIVDIEGFDPNSTEDDLRLELFHLDSSCLSSEIEAPPMAEEMVYRDGKLYIFNESASNKYIFGKFMSGNYVYAYDVNSLSK